MSISRDNQLTEQDLSIVLDVLRANQSLELTAHGVKVIEQELKYPIQNIEGFLRIFSGRKTINLASRTIDSNQVSTFLSEKSFPIANREELISRLVMAFERERMSQILAMPLESEKETKQGQTGRVS